MRLPDMHQGKPEDLLVTFINCVTTTRYERTSTFRVVSRVTEIGWGRGRFSTFIDFCFSLLIIA